MALGAATAPAPEASTEGRAHGARRSLLCCYTEKDSETQVKTLDRCLGARRRHPCDSTDLNSNNSIKQEIIGTIISPMNYK